MNTFQHRDSIPTFFATSVLRSYVLLVSISVLALSAVTFAQSIQVAELPSHSLHQPFQE